MADITSITYSKITDSEFGNKRIWIGIRPEDIYDTQNKPQNSNTAEIKTVLEVVEPMGNEIFLYFPVDGSQFTARIPAREKPNSGTSFTLFFDTNKLHYFDSETEESI